MPNIRIMNWNIENLSSTKVGTPGFFGPAGIPGMSNNIGKVIATAHNPGGGVAPAGADIAFITEVTGGSDVTTMTQISASANAASVALGGAANDYTGWLLSYTTGGEAYGVFIKDLNVIRPVVLVAAPAPGSTPTGTSNDSLDNLDKNRFVTWPGSFAAVPNAYAAALPAGALRPRLPLTDVFAAQRPTGRKRARFAGRTLADGGYALGRGFRLPCLILFEVLNAGGPATHLIAALVCHLGAVRGGANQLARGQIAQYKDTHIAQKFMNVPALAANNPAGSYVQLNGAVAAVQNLIVTGDFNVDFLEQSPPAPANALRTDNRTAYNFLTPTSTGGGSAGPAALPGAIGPVPAPGVPFPAPAAGNQGPIHTDIPNLALRAAETRSGTILHHYHAPPPAPANTLALRGACFDDIFYGGTQLAPTAQLLGPPVAAPGVQDAGFVHDVPAQIVQAGAAAAGTLDVSGAQAHYAVQFAAAVAAAPAPPPPPPPHFHYAYAAPNLAPGAPAAALTPNDRLIGTRFISDHLPTVVQFNLP